MKSKKFVPFIFLIAVLVVTSLACNLGASSEVDQDASVEATVRAVEEKRATDEAGLIPPDVGEPTPTEEPTDEASSTPEPTNTTVPTPTASARAASPWAPGGPSPSG